MSSPTTGMWAAIRSPTSRQDDHSPHLPPCPYRWPGNTTPRCIGAPVAPKPVRLRKPLGTGLGGGGGGIGVWPPITTNPGSWSSCTTLVTLVVLLTVVTLTIFGGAGWLTTRTLLTITG